RARTRSASTSPWPCSRGGQSSSNRPDAWAREQRSGSGNKVSARASDTALDQPGRGIIHRERSRWPTDPQDEGSRNSASCSTPGRQVSVQLAEQGIAVFFSPVGQMNYKSFDLFTL